jgi:hypothetical protein
MSTTGPAERGPREETTEPKTTGLLTREPHEKRESTEPLTRLVSLPAVWGRLSRGLVVVCLAAGWASAQTAQYRTIQSFGVVGAVGQQPYAGVVAGTTERMWFTGISGSQYQVLRSTNLVNWTGLGTIPMPVSGICTNVDAAAPAAGAAYRAAWVP